MLRFNKDVSKTLSKYNKGCLIHKNECIVSTVCCCWGRNLWNGLKVFFRLRPNWS